MKRNKTQKGISLIALIITIVVMLVLASVAISEMKGKGIIGHAGNQYNLVNEKLEDQNELLKNEYSYLNEGNNGKFFYETHTEHTWDSGVVTTSATCTATGVKTYTCTYDGCEATKTETISKLGHDYDATTTSATCTKAGTTKYTCSRCGDSYTTTIAALGHKPTYGGTQYVHTKCSVCGTTTSSTHSYSSKTTTSGTTKTTTYTCACGYSYKTTTTTTTACTTHYWQLYNPDGKGTRKKLCEHAHAVYLKCSNCSATKAEIGGHYPTTSSGLWNYNGDIVFYCVCGAYVDPDFTPTYKGYADWFNFENYWDDDGGRDIAAWTVWESRCSCDIKLDNPS